MKKGKVVIDYIYFIVIELFLMSGQIFCERNIITSED